MLHTPRKCQTLYWLHTQFITMIAYVHIVFLVCLLSVGHGQETQMHLYSGFPVEHWSYEAMAWDIHDAVTLQFCQARCDEFQDCIGVIYDDTSRCVEIASIHFDEGDRRRNYYVKGETWDPVVIPPCFHPGDINNGWAEGSGNVGNGASINYHCNEGYVMEGSYRRKCLGDNIWDNKAPKCKKATCGDVQSMLSKPFCRDTPFIPEDVCLSLGCCFWEAFGYCMGPSGNLYTVYSGKRPEGNTGFQILNLRSPESCHHECDIRARCKGVYVRRDGTDTHCHILDITWSDANNQGIIVDDPNCDFHTT